MELSKSLQPYSAILPTAEETLLLRAGLLGDRRAWRRWQSIAQISFIGHNPAIQKLRLLLSQAQQQHHFEMDKESQTFLRLFYFKEGLRREIYQRLFCSALNALNDSAIAVIVLKGAALAETVYAPSMRHCHDIDLLLDPADIGKAAEAVKQLGFQRAASPSSQSETSLHLDHDRHLPLELHTRLFQTPADDRITHEMLARVQRHSFFGVTARILSPEDSLLHVCAHAFSSPNRTSLRWVSDAWRILEKHPNFDWQLLHACALRGQLIVPLCVILSYVCGALDAPIPASQLEALRTAAASAK